MAKTVQDFLAQSTNQAAKDMMTAFLALPEDKRDWNPSGAARTAIDMMAECGLNNGITATLIETKLWADRPHEEYLAEKAELAAKGWDSVQEILQKSTERVVGVIQAVPTDALDVEVATPYGSGPLSGIMAYPYWNMIYHQGQIIYIGSTLE